MLLDFKPHETTRWVKTVRPGTDIGCGFKPDGWKFRCRRCGIVFVPIFPTDTRDVKIRERGDEKWARDNAIRKVWREGLLSERAIAKAFGVSRSTVWRAVRVR